MDSRKINDLPTEILQHIFSFLPSLTDRTVLSLVCRRWNQAAFDYSYLARIRLTLKFHKNNDVPTTLLRYYRSICIYRHLIVEEKDTKNLVKSFMKSGTSVEELACGYLLEFLELKLLSTCPRVKKLTFNPDLSVSEDKLPILETLKELDVSQGVTPGINVIRLAPNLRKLRARSNLYNLPRIIRTLPLQYLQVLGNHPDTFKECTEPTKLTALDLRYCHVPLEQLGRFCPLLTKLRLRPIASSIRPLASLTHLKVLSLTYLGPPGIEHDDLSNVKIEILEIVTPEQSRFEIGIPCVFPNVYYLKFAGGKNVPAPGNVRACFPLLKTLEIQDCKTEALFDLLIGLRNLRTLILHGQRLTVHDLPVMNGLQQLTLGNCELEMTEAMVTNFPSLQYLNLYGRSQFINYDEEMQPSFTVRRYRKAFPFDIFDVIQ